MGVFHGGMFNQVALYGDRPFFKSCESGAVYTENNTPLRICFLWWDVKQGNWFLSEKPPTTTGPSTAQEWSDLELVCRFSDNFKECFVPFNSVSHSGVCLGRVCIEVCISPHLAELLRPTGEI